jgi:hypothetical protein
MTEETVRNASIIIEAVKGVGIPGIVCAAVLYGGYQFLEKLTAVHTDFIKSTTETQRIQASAIQGVGDAMREMSRAQGEIVASQRAIHELLARTRTHGAATQ